MEPRKLFRDRTDAGKRLAAHLGEHRHASPVVLGLPRGGVPVAYEVARALGAPLDICVVRKLGAPLEPERTVGAVSEGGTLYVDRERMHRLGITEAELAATIETKRAAVDRDVKALRQKTPPMDVRSRTVILVDDGVATGGSARAALLTLRARGAGTIIVAIPVGASESLDELAALADEVVCLHCEDTFYAVSSWYEDFAPVTDADVAAMLDRVARARAPTRQDEPRPPRRQSERVRVATSREVRIPLTTPGEGLEARLTLPPHPRGLVIFAHGSGSSRNSPRNVHVATLLQNEGLATLLFDLLTEKEAERDAATGELRFDIPLLASRLVAVTDWAGRMADTRALDIGYFGASTGAAAALVAAAQRRDVVHAIVSRGGRPDLAEASLGDVKAPTLLLVGGLDGDILTLNRETLYFLACESRLQIVHEATHLFEEPGALDDVSSAATQWFLDHLRTPTSRGGALTGTSAR